MTDPPPEVVAAALALAEAASNLQTMHYADRSDAMLDAYEDLGRAYRAAIAPKRTREERDAEIVKVACIWSGSHRQPDLEWLERLCREATAPEPAEGPLDIDFPDPDPCSCDEALALKERITQALAHLEHRESYGRTDEYVRKAVEILKR